MAQKDFSDKNKRMLCTQVIGICCDPRCERMTVDPHDNPELGYFHGGNAAHIIPRADKKGIRYDPSYPEDHKNRPDNGIWLCRTCHQKVDQTKSDITAETLRQWKADMIRKVKNLSGQRFPFKEFETSEQCWQCPRCFDWTYHPEQKVCRCGATISYGAQPKDFHEVSRLPIITAAITALSILALSLVGLVYFDFSIPVFGKAVIIGVFLPVICCGLWAQIRITDVKQELYGKPYFSWNIPHVT